MLIQIYGLKLDKIIYIRQCCIMYYMHIMQQNWLDVYMYIRTYVTGFAPSTHNYNHLEIPIVII